MGRYTHIKMLTHIHTAPPHKYFSSQHTQGWVICGVRPILHTHFCTPLPLLLVIIVSMAPHSKLNLLLHGIKHMLGDTEQGKMQVMRRSGESKTWRKDQNAQALFGLTFQNQPFLRAVMPPKMTKVGALQPQQLQAENDFCFAFFFFSF